MFSLVSKFRVFVQYAVRTAIPKDLHVKNYSSNPDYFRLHPVSAAIVGKITPADPSGQKYRRGREVKRYYLEDGTHDPPVEEVTKRFMRLRSGIYIHPIPGRNRHLYRKPQRLREHLKQHIFTGRSMNFLMDNMLNASWRKPRFYPEDPYEPYHSRTGVPWDYRNKKRKFYP